MSLVILAVTVWVTNSSPSVAEIPAVGRSVVDLEESVTNVVNPLSVHSVFVRNVSYCDPPNALMCKLDRVKEIVVAFTNEDVAISLYLPEKIINRRDFKDEIFGPAIIKVTEIGPDLYYMEVRNEIR